MQQHYPWGPAGRHGYHQQQLLDEGMRGADAHGVFSGRREQQKQQQSTSTMVTQIGTQQQQQQQVTAPAGQPAAYGARSSSFVDHLLLCLTYLTLNTRYHTFFENSYQPLRPLNVHQGICPPGMCCRRDEGWLRRITLPSKPMVCA